MVQLEAVQIPLFTTPSMRLASLPCLLLPSPICPLLACSASQAHADAQAEVEPRDAQAATRPPGALARPPARLSPSPSPARPFFLLALAFYSRNTAAGGSGASRSITAESDDTAHMLLSRVQVFIHPDYPGITPLEPTAVYQVCWEGAKSTHTHRRSAHTRNAVLGESLIHIQGKPTSMSTSCACARVSSDHPSLWRTLSSVLLTTRMRIPNLNFTHALHMRPQHLHDCAPIHCIPFLEFLVEYRGVTDPTYHETLAALLHNRIVEIIGAHPTNTPFALPSPPLPLPLVPPPPSKEDSRVAYKKCVPALALDDIAGAPARLFAVPSTAQIACLPFPPMPACGAFCRGTTSQSWRRRKGERRRSALTHRSLLLSGA